MAPFCDGVIPTTLDRTLNPDGHAHLLAVHPVGAGGLVPRSRTPTELAAYADRMIDLYDAVAPGFRDSIIARDIVGPHEMETEYGLIGGNIFHGELSLEQLFHLRPAPGYADYRTPVRASTTPAPPPTPAAACAASPACRPPARPSRTPRAARCRRGGCCARRQPVTRAAVRPRLRRMLEARSVAVVGASDRPGSFGWRMATEVLRSPGVEHVHLVSTPAGDTVLGQPCVPSLADVPEPVDLVLLGVPDPALVDQVRLAAGARRRAAPWCSGRRTAWATQLAAAADGLELVRRRLHGLRQRRPRGARDRLPRAGPAAAGPIALVPTPARCSPRCCARTGGWSTPWPSPPARSWSPPPPTTSPTRWPLPETRVVGLVLETLRDAAGAAGRRSPTPPTATSPSSP